MGFLSWIHHAFHFFKSFWGSPATAARKKIGSEIYHSNGDVLRGYLDEVQKDADKLPDPPAMPGAFPTSPTSTPYTTAPSSPAVSRRNSRL